MKNLDHLVDLVEHDERAVAVENASYRLGFFLLSTAILWDGCYRVYVRHEAALDLMALVFASFAVCRVYQARQKVLVRGWLKKLLLMGLVGGVIGAIVGVIISIARYIALGRW